MKTVRYSKAAIRDLLAIDAYTLSEWGEAQAERYLLDLQESIVRLARNPLLGKACPQIRKELRRIEQDRHTLFYRYIDDEVLISRILHRSMLPRMDRFAEE